MDDGEAGMQQQQQPLKLMIITRCCAARSINRK